MKQARTPPVCDQRGVWFMGMAPAGTQAQDSDRALNPIGWVMG